MNFNSFSEQETRYNLIDPLLAKCGWNLSDRTQIWFEVPVDGYDASPQNGITDYCLFRANGEVLVVIEAKKTRRDARVGKEQVLQYVERIEKKQSFRPFGDMQADGLSLDDKRQKITQNDIPDIEKEWKVRSSEKKSKNKKVVWVSTKEIKNNKYDLSISRYKPVEHKAVEYEKPETIMEKIMVMEEEIGYSVKSIMKEIKK
jgi:hypothetical protein